MYLTIGHDEQSYPAKRISPNGKFALSHRGFPVFGVFDNAGGLNIEKAPWASPRKEVRPMRQFLVELAIQVIAGILVALVVDMLTK